MLRRNITYAAIIGLAVGASATVAVHHVRAAGAPEKGALSYSGILEASNGEAVTGTRNIGLALYRSEAGGEKVCEVDSREVSLTSGHFRVELPDACTEEVSATPDLWIALEVDGAPLGRSKLGAVPYAIEANHAAAADFADSAREAEAASGALAERIAGIEEALAARDSLPDPGACPDPEAVEKYGFCIWFQVCGGEEQADKCNFVQAAESCRAHGARLCSLAEVNLARGAGAEWCPEGWVSDDTRTMSGYRAFPVQPDSDECGPTAGLIVRPTEYHRTFDATCCKPNALY